MKKLMIAACAVAFAAVTQAGTVNWDSWCVDAIGSTDNTTLVDGLTAYLIAGSSETFYNDVVANGFSTAIGSATVFSSATQTAEGLSDPTVGTINTDGVNLIPDVSAGKYNLFMTILDGDGNVYISETNIGIDVPANGNKPSAYYHEAALEGAEYTLGDDFADAGWYAAALPVPPGPEPGGVPEPTSGLLLLIGMAGLALKRKIA